jgi:hypothetical protein
VPELLTWWTTGPVAAVLTGPGGRWLIPGAAAGVLAVMPVLIEDGDQLGSVVRTAVAERVAQMAASGRHVVVAVRVSVQRAAVSAALVVAVHAPHRPTGVAR